MTSYNEDVPVEQKKIDGDVGETDVEIASPTPGDGYGDTQNDLSDMHRLGKKQEFKVCKLKDIPLYRWTRN